MRLLFTALLLTLVACGGTQEGDADLKAKELELKERELELKEKEAEIAAAEQEAAKQEAAEEKVKEVMEELEEKEDEYSGVQDLIKQEKENRLSLVKLAKEKYRVNGWGNTVINGNIHNNAKLVTFKDYEITIDYLDGGGKKIGEDKFWINKEIKPNSYRPFEKRITGKEEGVKFTRMKITNVKY